MRKLLLITMSCLMLLCLTAGSVSAFDSKTTVTVSPNKGPKKKVKASKGKGAKITLKTSVQAAPSTGSTTGSTDLSKALSLKTLSVEVTGGLSVVVGNLVECTEEEVKADACTSDSEVLSGSASLTTSASSTPITADLKAYYNGSKKITVVATIDYAGTPLTFSAPGTLSIKATSFKVNIDLTDLVSLAKNFLSGGTTSLGGSSTSIDVSGNLTVGSKGSDSPIRITQCTKKGWSLAAYMITESGELLFDKDQFKKTAKCTRK